MINFSGELLSIDSIPICGIHGEYDHSGGRFTLPSGYEGHAKIGSECLLDLEDGPRLKVLIEEGNYTNRSSGVLEFSTRETLPHPTAGI